MPRIPSRRLRGRSRRLASAAVPLTALAYALILASASPASALDPVAVFQRDGLDFQLSEGFLAAEGPAAQVAAASEELMLGHVGNSALYTGAHESGTGFLVVTGDGVPPTIDFEITGMTAASVENDSAQLDAVYSDESSLLDAVVPARTAADIAPVDIDFAVYPLGSTPPPDNRGLNPNVQFTFR